MIKSSLRPKWIRCLSTSTRALQKATVERPPETIAIVPPVADLTTSNLLANDYSGSLVSHLLNRRLVESLTNDDLHKLTEPSASKLKVYCGADPTAPSLHLGNLFPLMVLLHFVLRGHSVVGLVGGATGAVGDPSGRLTERSKMEDDTRTANVASIEGQIRRFLENGLHYAKSRNIDTAAAGSIETVNNHDWWKDMLFLDFLATYGSHIRVSQMLARDSIQSRLKSHHGIGFNEFAYQVLQAFDFWHLFKTRGVNVQLGGNDQWGNITAGVDLISRLQRPADKAKPAFGLTVPLLTTSSGEKFGKSAGNAVFISESLTTPFQMYQYFINVPDDMLRTLLASLTLLPLDAIEGVILPKHQEDPGLRVAQRVLAREVTDLVHGPGVGDEMAYVTSFLFPTPDQPFDDDITADKLLSKLAKSGLLQKLNMAEEFPDPDDVKMSTLLSKVLGKSKNETRNLIKGGGVYLGVERDQLDDQDDVVLFDKHNHLLDGKLLLVRTGKQNYYIVEVTCT